MSDLTDEELMELAKTDPSAVIDIVFEEHDQPQTEERQEAFSFAGAMIAMSQLVRMGCSEAAVIRNFTERPWQIRFTQEPDDEGGVEIGVAVEWLDNLNPEELRPEGTVESNE